MNKKEFLKKLRKKLSGLPRADIEEQLAFYSEMIDDRIEEGSSEREAVAAIGEIDLVAQRIKEERSSADGGEKTKSPRKMSTGEVLLAVIGFPIWFPLLLIALSVMLSLYAVLWSLIIAVWAVELPFFIFSFISKYLFVFCKKATKCIYLFTKKSFLGFVRAIKGGKNS